MTREEIEDTFPFSPPGGLTPGDTEAKHKDLVDAFRDCAEAVVYNCPVTEARARLLNDLRAALKTAAGLVEDTSG